jgi:hypothetical protein
MIDFGKSASELWMGLGYALVLEGEEAGSEDPGFEAGIEPRKLPSVWGHRAAMGAGDSIDQAFAGKTAQIVAGLGRRVGGFARPQQTRHVAAQVLVAEAVRWQ